jgi:hypothetical protein
VKGAAVELDRVSTRSLASSQEDKTYLFFVAMSNLTLGRNGVARRLCDRIAVIQDRNECLLRVAYAAADRNLVREQLAQVRIYGPTISAIESDEAIALWVGDADTAEQNAPSEDLARIPTEVCHGRGTVQQPRAVAVNAL